MFTGIIEEIGIVRRVKTAGQSMELTISADVVLADVRLGDSIAVNGTCLTVTGFTDRDFTADIMPETFRATSLHRAGSGTRVNLERAMRADGRFGGHFVTGHVDGTAVVRDCTYTENALVMELTLPPEGRAYVLPKGSIAFDGTSLTIFNVQDDTVTISLIPHTRSATVLADRKPGDRVNVEFDMLAKYTEKMVVPADPVKQPLTASFLEQHGFK
ncbi:riboflavin synthase [Sporosarcina trichiuri]|uniref:riboflavin synthase n=1 Tax=Sporosarcina trichiuri TaxID=3056445 RepID=UPI0025B31CBD|nr:riboflavin synthase [Sporosarcina sp. 0.2-SM1T-5]WJY26850.1 riboflavin synthase [Sporosarcina sp. 0.2-SM1T-5]